MLRRRGASGAPTDSGPLWDASMFALDGVARFRDATDEQRRSVLDTCSASLLLESWFIERCGIEFCARMVLATQDLEERRLFALIGADEATHSTWLQPWVTSSDAAADTFNRFIEDCLRNGDPQPLAYLLQIVLEGFGIVHYSQLAQRCHDPALAATLERMSQDEALHHAGGLAVFHPERMNAAARDFLADASFQFLEMIRCGPQSVLDALDRNGLVSARADIQALFADLDAATLAAGKLARLRKLMTQPGMQWLLDNLDSRGAFEPCNAAQCAQIYVAMRSTA
jgi:rubrerythrin